MNIKETMAIGNKQIGWSQESNLLWEISKQLDRTISQMCTGPCPTTTTTTTILYENRFEFSEGNVPTLEEFEILIGFPLTNGIIEGNIIKFNNINYDIPSEGFRYLETLIDVVSYANIIRIGAFVACSNLTSVSFPFVTTIGASAFETDDALVNISIPSCVNLGSSPTDYSMFFDITGNVISVTINTVLTTINSGGMHAGIVTLQIYNTVTLTVV